MSITIAGFTFNLVLVFIMLGLLAIFVWQFTELPRSWQERERATGIIPADSDLSTVTWPSAS